MSVDTGLDLTLFEELTFTPALPCETRHHGKMALDLPAVWHAKIKCPCEGSLDLVICEPCRAAKMRAMAICENCGHVEESWAGFVILLEPIDTERA